LDTYATSITPNPPFDFDQVLSLLRAWPGAIVEQITADNEYRRAVYLEGRPALITVCSDGSIEQPHLVVTVTAEQITSAIQEAAVRTAERVFATHAAVAGIDETFSKDPVLWPEWHRFRGLRPVALPDLFESIVWAITAQQITVAFASKCKRALIERCGESWTVEGHEYILTPRPEVVAGLDDSDLLALQFSRQKARYILNLARQVARGEFDLEELWVLPADEAMDRLQGLVGIGRWTAEYVLLRALGHADAIPAGDVALQQVIGRAYLGRKATEAEVRVIAEAWAPWRGYAAMCWWLGRLLSRGRQNGRQPGIPSAE
jgi:DNA-3-methyladenine glycosylase II